MSGETWLFGDTGWTAGAAAAAGTVVGGAVVAGVVTDS